MSVRAVYFEEPADRYACVQRAWQSRLRERDHCTIFLRSRPGSWSSQDQPWSIKYLLDGDCAFEAHGLRCEVFAGYCFVIPAGTFYRSEFQEATALSVFGGDALRASPRGDTAPWLYGVFPLDTAERRCLGLRLAGFEGIQGSAVAPGLPDKGREVTLASGFPLPASYRRLRCALALWTGGSKARRQAAARLLKGRHYLTARFRDGDVCRRAAEAASMTRCHFSRQFSALFGVSPRQYVVAYRASVARILLESGRYSVEAAAGFLGYECGSSLAHLFQSQNYCKPRLFVPG